MLLVNLDESRDHAALRAHEEGGEAKPAGWAWLMDEADAGPLLRFRSMIGANHIAVLADIKKKHSSHAMTSDLTIEDWAHGAEFMGADGLIVTGAATGLEADQDEVAAAAAASTTWRSTASPPTTTIRTG